MAKRLNILLAGLEAGIIGGTAMLAWLAMVSLWHGRSVWSIPNLLASTFFGDDTLRRGFHLSTLSGLSLHLLISTALGIAFSLATSRLDGRGRVLLLGIASALAWYFVGFAYLWRHINPLVLLYSPDIGMLVAHVVFGVAIGLHPGHLASLQSQSDMGRR